MSKTKRARDFLSPTEAKALSDVVIHNDLKKRKSKAYPYGVTDHKSLSKKDVYTKVMDGDWYLCPPEKAKSGDYWSNDFMLILEKVGGE